jgi:hypothetical protein
MFPAATARTTWQFAYDQQAEIPTSLLLERFGYLFRLTTLGAVAKEFRRMPPKHPPYPHVEPDAVFLPDLEIEILADRNAVDWGYRDGECLDAVCKHVGLEIEYSHYPNEILLEVPLDDQPVVWLQRNGRTRDDRVAVATALGYWSLHVEKTRAAHPGCGIQALYEPTATSARKEAVAYGMAFLMPKAEFMEAWHAGRSQAASSRFDVPTKTAYLRAETLDLGLIG